MNYVCRLEQLKLERGDSLKNLRTTALLNLGNISVTGLYKYQVRVIRRSLCFDGIYQYRHSLYKIAKGNKLFETPVLDTIKELIWVGDLETEQYLDCSVIS
jgi:hypothetical protein